MLIHFQNEIEMLQAVALDRSSIRGTNIFRGLSVTDQMFNVSLLLLEENLMKELVLYFVPQKRLKNVDVPLHLKSVDTT